MEHNSRFFSEEATDDSSKGLKGASRNYYKPNYYKPLSRRIREGIENGEYAIIKAEEVLDDMARVKDERFKVRRIAAAPSILTPAESR